MNSTADKRVIRLIGTLRDLGVHQNAAILVGLSGGGDSMALFSLLHDASERYPLRLAAARISHGIRTNEEEKRESVLCRQRAESWGIPYLEKHIAPGRITTEAAEGGRGMEQIARTLRRETLETIRNDHHRDYIALGHTADDQVETVLMRLFRGSGPEGLAGIPRRHGRVIRPLLGFARTELRDYLSHSGITWVEDSSNTDLRFLRNRVRAELIPLMEEIFPGWPSSIKTLADRSDSAREALEMAEKTVLPREEEGTRTRWRLGDWETAPFYIKARSLWSAYDRADPEATPDSRFPWSDVVELIGALEERKSREKRRFRVSVVDNRVVAEPVRMHSFHAETGDENGKLVSPSAGRGNRGWSVLLEREDIAEGNSVVVGGFRIIGEFQPRHDAAAFGVPAEGWPLRVEMVDGFGRVEDRTGGGAEIGETSPRAASSESLPPADDLGEMVYISIVPA